MSTIRAASADRVSALAAVLATSFAEDSMVAWPLHQHDVVERAEPMFTALLEEYAQLDMLWEADDAAGMVAWIPPGSDVGLEQVDLATRPMIAGLTDDGGERHRRLWDWLETFVPEEPHWMLDMVGVEPSRQGEGIGSALVRHGLDLATADGVPVFLETGNPRNVPYYERFGLRVAHEEDAPDGGPHIWFMRTGMWAFARGQPPFEATNALTCAACSS